MLTYLSYSKPRPASNLDVTVDHLPIDLTFLREAGRIGHTPPDPTTDVP